MNIRTLPATLLLCALAAVAADGPRPDKPEAGDAWIRNRQVRVSLTMTREPNLTWAITGERWDVSTHAWAKTFSGSLVGDFRGPDAAARRERYHCYYPFQRVTEPGQPDLAVDQLQTTVADGSAALAFRIAKQDLWCRARVRILLDTPLLQFESLETSHPDLHPHWTLNLAADQPLLRLVADRPGMPAVPYEIEAKNVESRLVNLTAQRYCAAYRPDADRFFLFVWPAGPEKPAPHGMLWPKAGGLGSVYLDAPFVFLAENMACDKELHTIAHLAEGARSQALGILLPEAKAGVR
jgi:hypothetical protein